eukprot:TRINITY_DN3959_c0_g2_i1.p1 TRINITY_DN3959_c0_g2~~TRINITY_DN3959_c0_g2_i1.p1  ORF type:complete len:323 (+),score=107.91 TRINITY_DN3959_c0_g2_i1:19-987(+)
MFITYVFVFFFQAEDGIRDLVRSRGLGDVYKRQMDESQLVGSTIDEMITKLIGTDCAPNPYPKAPAILLLRNFSSSKEDDGYAAFGSYTPRVSYNDTDNYTSQPDAFTEDHIQDFLDLHTTEGAHKLRRENVATVHRPTDTPDGRTLVKMFVADGAKSAAELKSLRCVRQMMHREARFMYHDERHETGKPVVGANMSDGTMTALLDYGLGGSPRPLLVLDQLEEDGVRVSKYALRYENSPSYLVRQIRRAASGQLPQAVKSEPADGAGVTPGRAGRVVGSTLGSLLGGGDVPVSYTHLRAHETVLDLVCRLLLEKKKQKHKL